MLDWSSWSPELVVGVTLVSLLLVVLAVVLFMCVQAGLFHTIHIKTTQPEFGELVVMYKCGRGAYSESGAMFTESHSLLPEYNTIGVYYDDPEKKSSENLRYIVGLVVSEGGADVNDDHIALLESRGYKRAVFPAVKHAVTTDFPYRNTLSCIFAVFRVYPTLREYVERRELCAHPILEIYDNRSQRILFTGPLEQQNDFYVPEVLDDALVSSHGEEEEEEGDEDDVEEEEEEESCEEDRETVTTASVQGEDGSSVRGGSSIGGRQPDSGWEQSASMLAEGVTATAAASGVPQGSAEESDTNTGSSFEEIDANETAGLPAEELPPPQRQQQQAEQAPSTPPHHHQQQDEDHHHHHPAATTTPPTQPSQQQEQVVPTVCASDTLAAAAAAAMKPDTPLLRDEHSEKEEVGGEPDVGAQIRQEKEEL